MADILGNWLNNEIELSKQVINFEQDFANGYLFGELLFKFNQQSNFKEFSKADNVASKLQNFSKLETTLRNLKIKFDSKMINDIIQGKRGEALRLLFQIKMSLEKVYPPTDIAVLRKSNTYIKQQYIAGKMGDNQPALKIAHSKEKYDSHAHTFFDQRLQVLNKPQKILNQESHLQKFEDEKVRQESYAKQYTKEMQEQKDKIKQEIRKAQINKLQRNAGFMEEWLQKGAEDWKKNQTIKKDREMRDLKFEYSQAQKYDELAKFKVTAANREVHDGIAQFEQSLQHNYGISTKVNKEEADRAISEHFINSPLKQKGSQRLSSSQYKHTNVSLISQLPQTMIGGGITLTSTGLKTKDKKTVTEKTRKERERRRRKMIVDQGKTHIEMEQKRRNDMIIERLAKQSKQELELAYEEHRTKQCKQIITENRRLREVRYEKRRELDQQTENWREEEMLYFMKDQMERDLQTMMIRDGDMRISQKQKKREKRTEVALQIFDCIFEIANKAYIHQQQNDCEEIDNRNWHEWLSLFINKKDENMDQEYLDQQELEDYLANKGQWPDSLVQENKPPIEQILLGLTDNPQATTAKGAKAAPAKQAQEQVVLEEGDTEIAIGGTPNNFILGDAVEKIISINYPEREPINRPLVPHYLGMKMCLIGYAFAGKNIQSQMLKEQLFKDYGFDLECIEMKELVEEAIDFANNNPEPIVIHNDSEEEQIQENTFEINEEQENQDGENQELIEGQEESQQIQEVQEKPKKERKPKLNPYEDLRQCGIQIQELLLEGLELPDKLYIDLFIAKIRIKFPYKSDQELFEEENAKIGKVLEIVRQLGDIEKEQRGEIVIDQFSGKKKRKRSPEQISEEEQSLQDELKRLRQIDQSGWVLVDFPCTFAQAKLLETALSGYIPQQECELVQREKALQEAQLLAKPTDKPKEEQSLLKSGLDCVFWLNQVERQECIRRAIGRRWDPINEKMYHINDQPPLTTNAPLCERLIPIDDIEHKQAYRQNDDGEQIQQDKGISKGRESKIIDQWIGFDNEIKGIVNWCKKFGDQDSQEVILKEINANQSIQNVFEDISTQVRSLIDRKCFHLNSKIDDVIQQENQRIREELQKQEEEEEKQRILQEQAQDESQELNQQEEQPKQEERKVQKPEQSERIPPKEASIQNVDNDIKPTLLQVWQALYNNYISQMHHVFGQVRTQRGRLIDNLSQIQQTFLSFLHRADIKQDKLEQFITDFNTFSDQYPDLREDDQTKEELHQRTDILSDELWEIIEERRDQEIEERKKIMESGMVEYEIATFTQTLVSAFQYEVDRFKQCVQLIYDYYHTFEDKLIPDMPLQFTIDLIQDGDDGIQFEQIGEGQDIFNVDNYSYPRIEKVFERALKCQIIGDINAQNNAAQGDKKGAPVKGKDPKKPALQEEEKQVEESQYLKEMKQGIKIEKSILRYRLIMLRNWALKMMKDMRQRTLKVYQKLDDWILVSKKAENDAMDELLIVIKRAIEEEKKIQDELRLKFMDFCVDEKIQYFIVPPPEKLPPLEQYRPDRYSIPQLRSLVNDLKMIQQHNTLPNKAIVDLFVRKLQNSKSLKDINGVPHEWSGFSEYEFMIMVRNLDKYGTGFISWKIVANINILLNSPIPTDKEADSYAMFLQEWAKDGFIEKENFIKVAAWFDDSEHSIDRNYSVPYPRVQYIKEILFDVNKEEGQEKMNIKKFISTIKMKELTMFKKIFRTYSDIIFAKIEAK